VTRDEISKSVNHFMNTLLEKGLLKTNTIDKKILTIFADSFKRHDLSASSFKKINNACKDNTLPLTIEEHSLFVFQYVLGNLNVTIELIKLILKSIVDPEKIKFDEDTTYGTLLTRCFDKLGYDKNFRQFMRDVFLLDFRNSYTHLDYHLDSEMFAFNKKNGELIKYSYSQLQNLQMDFIITTETMLGFLEKYESKF